MLQFTKFQITLFFQYASAIFYHDNEQKALAEKTMKEQQSKTPSTIVTRVESAKEFYNAEE